MEEDSVALHVLGVIQAELDGGVGIHHRSDGIFVLVRAYTTTHRLDADLAADAEFHHAIPIVFFENEGLDVRVELGQRRVMVRRAEIVAEIDGAARVLGRICCSARWTCSRRRSWRCCPEGSNALCDRVNVLVGDYQNRFGCYLQVRSGGRK